MDESHCMMAVRKNATRFGAPADDLCVQDRSAIQAFAILSTLFFVLTAAAYFATIAWVEPIPRDSTTLVVGRDFLNFWMYGRAAVTPDASRFYDPHVYNEVLWSLLGRDYPGQNWSYPPSIMLVAAPFGQLGYMPALLCWTILTLPVFLWVASSHIIDRRLLVALLFSPAAIFCLMSGQSSFITAAMLITIFVWLDLRPISAGILIGLLSLKPQLGVLFPIMLIASARWRVFLAAAVTTVVIAALTAALFGPQVWIDYVLKGIPVQNLVLADPARLGTPFMPTIFMNVRGVDASYGTAMAVQACFSAFAIGAVVWAYKFRRDADPHLLAALFLACSVGGVPYLMAYDVLALTFAALLLLAAGKLDEMGRHLAKLVYWLPLIQIGLGMFHVPGPALIAPAFALYLLVRLRDLGEESRRLGVGVPIAAGQSSRT
jgi:hypothetical protein